MHRLLAALLLVFALSTVFAATASARPLAKYGAPIAYRLCAGGGGSVQCGPLNYRVECHSTVDGALLSSVKGLTKKQADKLAGRACG